MPYVGKEPVRGQNRELDDISGSFNGGNTAFTMQVGGVNTAAGSANQVFINLGGVMQNPGTDFTVASSTITFTTPPASGLSFWGLIQGDAVDIQEPADGSVTAAKLASGAGIAVLTGSTNNTITTVTGAGAIQGESGLTFDGSTMNFTAASGDARLTLIGTEGNNARISLVADDGDDHIDQYNIRSNADDNSLSIDQFESGSFVERVTIANGGNVGIGNNNPDQKLKIEDSSNFAIHLLKTGSQDTLIQNTGQTEICAATGGASGQRIVFRIGANTGSMPEIARFTPDGLCFGSDTAAANALDDYEEGSWNASISGAEGGGPTSYSGSGSYIKIGRLVYATLAWSNVTFPGLGGQLQISAPFTAGSDAKNPRGGWCYFHPNSAWDDYTDMVGMGARISAGESSFKLDVFLKDNVPTSQSAGSGGRNGNISEASSIYLDFSITYITA